MLVGVCDFPGSYAFPRPGTAGSSDGSGQSPWAPEQPAPTCTSGSWLRRDLGPGWTWKPLRLEDTVPGSPAARELRSAGYDLMVVGHEYPTLPAWRRTRDELGCNVVTFQHDPDFQHAWDAFDGHRSRLYCYSPEMTERYAAHQPILELAVHLGLNEAEAPSIEGQDLVWLGRIDEEKAPHLAIRAAQILGRRIRVVGPVFDSDYAQRREGSSPPTTSYGPANSAAR